MYQPFIEYTYVVNGEEHRGYRLSFSEKSYGFAGEAESQLRGVKEGNEIDVYYDPKNPRNSVVFNGPRSQRAEVVQSLLG